ncbi:MAG: hypothetical protein IPM35_24610 [Myxococcales bacterium]|nr:hypothetical protein [Myxococcales bacterium]
MPAITAQSVVPTPRPGVEAQIAAVPGYYLSESVQEDANGTAMGQAAVMFEPGELIGAPGLAIGGRYVGDKENGGYPEPMLRYRRYVDPNEVFALGGVIHGGYGHGSASRASYEATRGGAELGFDLRTTPRSQWIEVHFAGSVGVTGLDASGDYCLDTSGRWGVDCPDEPDPVTLTHATASGFYPSASGAIALDLARHLSGVLHGGRIALHGAVGRMPRVEGGEQISGETYTAAGLSVTLGLGAREPDKR